MCPIEQDAIYSTAGYCKLYSLVISNQVYSLVQRIPPWYTLYSLHLPACIKWGILDEQQEDGCLDGLSPLPLWVYCCSRGCLLHESLLRSFSHRGRRPQGKCCLQLADDPLKTTNQTPSSQCDCVFPSPSLNVLCQPAHIFMFAALHASVSVCVCRMPKSGAVKEGEGQGQKC